MVLFLDLLLSLLLPFKMLKFSWFTGHTKRSCKHSLAHGPVLLLSALNSFLLLNFWQLGIIEMLKMFCTQVF